MDDTPWLRDACSLVDELRAGRRSPVEELEATIAAIERTELNCFAHLDFDRARDAAARADLSLPFGGVPTGIKELDPVAGWPYTEASLVFRDRVADKTAHIVERLCDRGGVVPVGSTTSSEFGGLNVSVTRMNGVTHNPWQRGRTAGGSSGGSASAVAGGLVSLATGGDGGGSIRIPAGYNGLLGMKGTFGRTPRSPGAYMRPHTVVLGILARSVRDAARHYDVVAGTHNWDATSLPSHGRWEAQLGSHELRGKRVAIVPDLGGAILEPGVEAIVREHGERLAREAGMEIVERRIDLPNLAAQWMMGNMATLIADMGGRWPSDAHLLTDEVAIGARLSETFYNLHTAATAEAQRVRTNEVMGATFDDVDFVIAATNPGPAFPAEAAMSSDSLSFVDAAKSNPIAKLAVRALLFGVRALGAAAPKAPNAILDAAASRFPDLISMGALTIVSNIYGNPAVSIPVDTIDGLPIGMQVLARRHEDELLFDVARHVEREHPWPMVAESVLARDTGSGAGETAGSVNP